MGEFFRGWRRKLGVLTLVMALGFMTGWVRSLIQCDKVQWRGMGNKIHVIESNSGRWQWETISNALIGDAAYSRMTACQRISPTVTISTITGCDLTEFYSVGLAVPYKTRNRDDDTNLRSEFGLEFYRIEWGGDRRFRNWTKTLSMSVPQRTRYEKSISTASVTVVPYWSITIPMTLISALLLLTKPRKSTPMKISEPIPIEGK